MKQIASRVEQFCASYGLQVPILLAPMAGASSPSLSIAVANAGGLGACGALLMQPAEIVDWARQVRAGTSGPFQINLWIPDPPPVRNARHESLVREFLGHWGPTVSAEAGDATPPSFDDQCKALLEAAPPIASSVMGLFSPAFVREFKRHGMKWFAVASTVTEARAAADAGADAIIAQGAEAGGHRGCFDASQAEAQLVGLFSLLPAVVDAVKIPVIATGGIADARGVLAALVLGASAVQIGTGFLRCPEANIHPAWAEALSKTLPEQTTLTRAFSGRAGRSITTDYVKAANSPSAPTPAAYPIQRGLTSPMRAEAQRTGDIQRIQAWAGQSAALGKSRPAAEYVKETWEPVKAQVYYLNDR